MTELKMFMFTLLGLMIPGILAGLKAYASKVTQDSIRKAVDWVLRRRAAGPAESTGGDLPGSSEVAGPPWTVVPAGHQTRAEYRHLIALTGADGSPRMFILRGLPGSGKTQIAAEVARHFQRMNAVIVWVDASSRSKIIASYAAALKEFSSHSCADNGEAAARLLQVLSTTRRRWLVVLDHVMSAADLEGLWPSTMGSGWTVVTTRRRDAALDDHNNELIEVGAFTPEESSAFLDQRLAGLADQPGARQDLVEVLENHPQALALAARFIRDEGWTCSRYADRIRRRWSPSAQPGPADHFDQHLRALAAPFLSALPADDTARARCASLLLEAISILGHDVVADQILSTPALRTWVRCGAFQAMNKPDRAYLIYRDDPARQRALLRWIDRLDPPDNELEVGRIVRWLHLLGVVRQEPGLPLYIHPLVRLAFGQWMTPTRLRTIAQVAADALLDAWPPDEHDRALNLALEARGDVLTTQCADLLWTAHKPHPLLPHLGRRYSEAGRSAKAATLYEQLARLSGDHLGWDHPQTLLLRADHAHWLGESGNGAEAMRRLAELRTVWRQLLGRKHPQTLAVRHQYAYWVGKVRKPARAIRVHRSLLDVEVRVLGVSHPQTLSTLTNLASLRGRAGDACGAAEAMKKIAAAWQTSAGRADPGTLKARSNHAHWHGKSGDPAGAVALLRSVYEECENVLGRENVLALTIRHNIAQSLGEAGRIDGAIAEFEQLLVDLIGLLGTDHPQVELAEERLAYWRTHSAATP